MSSPAASKIIKLDIGPDRQTEAVVKATMALVELMSPMQREAFLRQITEKLRPIAVPKAGDVLSFVVQSMPKGREWSIKELKDKATDINNGISDKEIYNAVGYLTRKNHITRVAQGRYIINGVAVISADDFGGEPRPTEGDLNND